MVLTGGNMRYLFLLLLPLWLHAQPAMLMSGKATVPVIGSVAPPANCVSNSVYASAQSTLNVNDSSGEVYAFTCITNVSEITACGVQFREQRQGVVPKSFQVEIRADNSFAPGTVIASSDVILGTAVETNMIWQAKIDLTNTVTLAANTRYWIGRKFDAYTAAAYYIATTGPVLATGTSKASADGSSWSDLTSRQFMHTIWAQ
jgi:hypothetical protein